MKKIIISENAEKKLIKHLIKEENEGMSSRVSLIKDFLDNNFLKAVNSIVGDDGLPKNVPIVVMVDAFKQPKQYMSDVDLFYLLQDKFKNILPADEDNSEDEEVAEDIKDILDDALKDVEKKVKKITHNNRDNFIKQVIKDWYYNKISSYGNLTKY